MQKQTSLAVLSIITLLVAGHLNAAMAGQMATRSTGMRPGIRPHDQGTLSVSPNPAAARGKVTVTLNGFTTNEAISLLWGSPITGTLLGTGTTDGTGHYAWTNSIVVPYAYSGAYDLWVVGNVSHAQTTTSLNVMPTMRITPISGPPGTKITITGLGFQPYEQVNIGWDYANNTIGTGYATGTGAFAYIIAEAPSGQFGTHFVFATGANSQISIQAGYSLAPSMFTLPFIGTPNGTTYLQATGLPPSTQIYFYLGNNLNYFMGSGYSDGNGRIQPPGITLTIPAGAPLGLTQIQARYNTGLPILPYGNANFDVVAGGTPTLVAFANVPADSIQVGGLGFGANENVDFTWTDNNGTQDIETVQADSHGFVTSDPFPPFDWEPGHYTITGIGNQNNSASTSYAVSGYRTILQLASVNGQANLPQTVTVSGGAFFAPNETVDVAINGVIFSQPTADNSGSISGSVIQTFINAALPKLYTITATGESSGATGKMVYATKYFNTLLTPSATSVSPGDIVSLNGGGFLGGEYISLYFNVDGTAIPLGTIGAYTGSFTGFRLQVPSLPHHASYTITAVGSASGAVGSVTVHYGAAPAAAVAPLHGAPGIHVTVQGSQFLDNEPVNVYWTGSTVRAPILLGTTIAASDGTFLGSVTTPMTATRPGPYAVRVVGTKSNITINLPYTVDTAAMTVTPTSGNAGRHITANGANFGVGESVTLYFGGTLIGTFTADGTGHVVVTNFPSPLIHTYPGTYTLTLTGKATGARAAAPFTVAQPTLVVNPGSGSVGATVYMTGTLWGANEKVSLYWGPIANNKILATVIVNASGEFDNQPVVIQSGGNGTISGKGFSTNDVVTIPFQVVAPPASPGSQPRQRRAMPV